MAVPGTGLDHKRSTTKIVEIKKDSCRNNVHDLQKTGTFVLPNNNRSLNWKYQNDSITIEFECAKMAKVVSGQM